VNNPEKAMVPKHKYKTEVLSSRSKIKNNWFWFQRNRSIWFVYVANQNERPIEPQYQYPLKLRKQRAIHKPLLHNRQ
jgi:hypothetical protein